MKDNIDNTNPIDLESDNKKLTFDSNLDPEINSEYINHWNDNFIRDPDFDDEKQDYKKPMDKIIETDLSEFKKQIYTKQNTNDQGKYGVISEKFMSYLMYERLYLMERENILWEILNANKNFTNVNNESIAEVDLSNQLNETQNSRIKKLMETNFGDRLIKDSNYDASDVEDCYLEYAKSKYADRYFFYFSRLRKLSEYTFHSVNKEYKKYNVENIKKVKAEIKKNEKSIYPLPKHVDEANPALNEIRSKTSKLKDKDDGKSINDSEKLIDDIKEGWRRQYYKFIFAYMLEHPDKIPKLKNVIRDFDSDTKLKFIEFLLKYTNHKNFYDAFYGFARTCEMNGLSFRKEKNTLLSQYSDKINELGYNEQKIIRLLLSNNEITGWEAYRANLFVVFVLSIVDVLLVGVPCVFPYVYAGIIDLILHGSSKALMLVVTSSVSFYIFIALAAVCAIWLVINEIKLNSFEKSLQRSPRRKSLEIEQQLTQSLQERSDLLKLLHKIGPKAEENDIPNGKLFDEDNERNE